MWYGTPPVRNLNELIKSSMCHVCLSVIRLIEEIYLANLATTFHSI